MLWSFGLLIPMSGSSLSPFLLFCPTTPTTSLWITIYSFFSLAYLKSFCYMSICIWTYNKWVVEFFDSVSDLEFLQMWFCTLLWRVFPLVLGSTLRLCTLSLLFLGFTAERPGVNPGSLTWQDSNSKLFVSCCATTEISFHFIQFSSCNLLPALWSLLPANTVQNSAKKLKAICTQSSNFPLWLAPSFYPQGISLPSFHLFWYPSAPSLDTSSQ